jgi:uncharacterized membrane protein
VPRSHLHALVAITAAGAALRFSTLDLQSFAHDEAGTVVLTRMGLGHMLSTIPSHETTPPLYFVVAWLWTKLFGDGEVGLRSLSALLGTATIPFAYAAGAALCSRRVGLGVAALTAFNPFLLWYSQEARSYALVVLLTTVSLYLFARLLEERSESRLALWAAASALALATHYFAVFAVAPEAVWLVVTARRRRRAALAAGAMAAVGLALLPLALHQRATGFAHFIADTGLGLRVVRTAKEFLIGFDLPAEIELTVLAAAIALAGALLVPRLRGAERQGALAAGAIALAAGAPPLLLALVGLDYLNERNLIVAWLPASIFVVAGLVGAGRRAGYAALAALCSFGLLSMAGLLAHPTWQRTDYRGAARAVGAASRPTVIAVTPGSTEEPFLVYRGDAVGLPPDGATVRSLVLALQTRPDPAEIHPAGPPRARRLRVPGFTEVGRRDGDTYTVIRLSSRRTVRVTWRWLRGLHLGPSQGLSAFLQRG